jgi:uncharacterized protein
MDKHEESFTRPSVPSSRPVRSRFNFSNNRIGGEEPETFYNEEREARRTLRRQNKTQVSKYQDNDLSFNVAQLLREPEGSTRTYEVEEALLLLSDEGTEVAKNLKGKARFTRVRHEILVQGDFETDVTINCVRCLNDFDTHIDFSLEDQYRPSIDVVTGLPVAEEEVTDEGTLLINQNHLLDLSEALRQQILVSLPMYPLCREDCPGLYEHLERANSDVPTDEDEDTDPDETVDVRWSALSKFRPEN